MPFPDLAEIQMRVAALEKWRDAHENWREEMDARSERTERLLMQLQVEIRRSDRKLDQLIHLATKREARVLKKGAKKES